jgi:aryl-alcohol dehydrogenase-like predicted oxidoreductase
VVFAAPLRQDRRRLRRLAIDRGPAAVDPRRVPQKRNGERQLRRVIEKDYEIVDLLTRIAKELGTTVPRVALAWVRSRPGVGSPIIGGRTIEHFEDNVRALDVTLTAAQVVALDAVSVEQRVEGLEHERLVLFG